MKYFFLILFLYQFAPRSFGQVKPQTKIPSYFIQQKSFTDSLINIIHAGDLDGSYDAGEDGMEKISFAVINLNSKIPVIGGLNMNNFIYPASVYKMYVAMVILKQISEGRYSQYLKYIIKSPNDVDVSSEISWDPRPLLKAGDTVTIHYLLDLMITRSDNSAANCLIDVAGRENINKTMHLYGWYGSEVTRKYLSRKFEDPGYEKISSTETNALHAVDFMYKIQTNTLVNPWVSMKMKALLGGQLDSTKLSSGLPPNTMFYHKSGWWSYYTNDVGIVDDGKVKYIIALFTPVPEEKARARMKIVSEKVYELLKRNK